MRRMKRASPCSVVATGLGLLAAATSMQAKGQPAASSAAPPSLDYGFFKAKVEPVFLAKRAGHTRCVVCHTINNAPLHLVPLSPGTTAWNDERWRRNFQLVQKVVVPGYEGSKLLPHPLAEAAGGDPHHGGGKHFGSQQDPEWSILKAFVFGAK